MTTYLFNKNLFYGSLYSLLNEDDMSVDHVRSIGLIILFFFEFFQKFENDAQVTTRLKRNK